MFSRIFRPVFMVLILCLGATSAHAAAKDPQYPFVDSPALKKAPIPGDFWVGEANAQIVFIEYASLSCPHCAHFHRDVLPVLKERYIDTGKMLYILRPFPLNEPALKGSLLLDCVGEEQGNDGYYTFARVLFGAQNKWAFDLNFESSLETFARVGGVTPEKFEACMSNSEAEIKILKIKKEGGELGVNHTPFFFINNHIYDAEPTAEAITTYLDNMLGIPHEPVKKDKKKDKGDAADESKAAEPEEAKEDKKEKEAGDAMDAEKGAAADGAKPSEGKPADTPAKE